MCGGKSSSAAPAAAPAPAAPVVNVTDYSALQTRQRAPQSSTMDQVKPTTDTGSSYGSTLSAS